MANKLLRQIYDALENGDMQTAWEAVSDDPTALMNEIAELLHIR